MKFIEEQIDATHSRIAVFGGWVLTTYTKVAQFDSEGRPFGSDFRMSQVVISDENHEWVIEK